MARMVIHSSSNTRVLAIRVQRDRDGDTFGVCPVCGLMITNRGRFEDTIEAIEIHADRESCS